MIKGTVYRLATLLALLATVVVSTASYWYAYQEDVPEELLK